MLAQRTSGSDASVAVLGRTGLMQLTRPHSRSKARDAQPTRDASRCSALTTRTGQRGPGNRPAQREDEGPPGSHRNTTWYVAPRRPGRIITWQPLLPSDMGT